VSFSSAGTVRTTGAFEAVTTGIGLGVGVLTAAAGAAAAPLPDSPGALPATLSATAPAATTAVSATKTAVTYTVFRVAWRTPSILSLLVRSASSMGADLYLV
jgi:hypothetical protein